MRTYTDKDGVYVHVGDLMGVCDRLASPTGRTVHTEFFYNEGWRGGMRALAAALRHLESEALKDAVRRHAERRCSLFF